MNYAVLSSRFVTDVTSAASLTSQKVFVISNVVLSSNIEVSAPQAHDIKIKCYYQCSFSFI